MSNFNCNSCSFVSKLYYFLKHNILIIFPLNVIQIVTPRALFIYIKQGQITDEMSSLKKLREANGKKNKY